MSKLNKVLLVIVIILVVVLGGLIFWQKVGFEKPYYAVYLSTGDIYFGQLNRFPKLSLSDVWFIQRNANNQQSPLSLVKFEQAFWGPSGTLDINKDDVVWMVKLKPDSQVVNFIKNPPAPQAQGQQSQQPQSVQQPASPDSSKTPKTQGQ